MVSLDASAPARTLPVAHSFIGAGRVEGRAGRRAVVAPATGEPFAEVSLLDAEQAGDAVAAAARAFPDWSRRSFAERRRCLLALHEAIVRDAAGIADLVSREQGKPPAEALAVEVLPALEHLRHLAEHAEQMLRDDALRSDVLLFAHKEGRLVYSPLGVVLVITPWNYPFGISTSGVAAALAAGNTVVLKPAPATTLTALRLGELCRAAGLPDGVVGVVATDDAVAGRLVEDPRVAKIVFTGSVATGRRIMLSAAQQLTPVVLELGGKDPAVVCRDADLEQAARGIVWGAFLNAGQTCASVERVYVEEPVAERFVGRVVELTRQLRVGDPAAGEVDVGPLTLERQRRLVEEHVADAVARGASALTGGTTPHGPGWFYPPTVLTGVDHAMRVMREETFGPVLPIMTVPNLDEAIRLANDSEYGLTASGWTRDPETARRLQRELVAGAVTINDCVASYGEPAAPWGGARRWSGVGRTHGLAGMRELVQARYVSNDPSRRPLLWWYPYDREYARLVVAAAPALHSRSPWSRLRNQLRLVALPRFWRRASLVGVLRSLDRLF